MYSDNLYFLIKNKMYKSNSCSCCFYSRDSHFRISGRGFFGVGFSIPTKSGGNGNRQIFHNITAQQSLCKLSVALAKGGEGAVNATLSLGECVRTSAFFFLSPPPVLDTHLMALCDPVKMISEYPFFGMARVHTQISNGSSKPLC